MAQKILLKENKTFRGPYSHDEPPLSGESERVLTTQEYADWNALERPDAQGRMVLFDPSFRYGDLDECCQAGTTLRYGLRCVFRKLSTAERRAKLRTMFATFSLMFDRYGDNPSAYNAEDFRQMIIDFDPMEDQELIDSKAEMLALPQWPV